VAQVASWAGEVKEEGDGDMGSGLAGPNWGRKRKMSFPFMI
jgi:hypothetical protein